MNKEGGTRQARSLRKEKEQEQEQGLMSAHCTLSHSVSGWKVEEFSENVMQPVQKTSSSRKCNAYMFYYHSTLAQATSSLFDLVLLRRLIHKLRHLVLQKSRCAFADARLLLV